MNVSLLNVTLQNVIAPSVFLSVLKPPKLNDLIFLLFSYIDRNFLRVWVNERLVFPPISAPISVALLATYPNLT